MQNTNTWANNPRHYTSLQSTTRCSNEIFVKFYKTCSDWCKPCSPNATNNGDWISTVTYFHYSTFTIFWFFSFALHSVVDYKFHLSRGFFLKIFFLFFKLFFSAGSVNNASKYEINWCFDEFNFWWEGCLEFIFFILFY